MISILIPVYNYNVESLVAEIVEQIKRLGLAAEIVISDDCSNKEYLNQYKNLDCIKEVSILYSNLNHGRSINRNKLAEAAKNQYMIFIDSDVKLTSNFVENYVKICKQCLVAVGGIIMANPEDDEGKFYFRRYFGISRESVSLAKRIQEPYRYFNSCNFLISKEVFKILTFNEEIITYGYEDTKFGSDLLLKGIKIHHIDNPVVHYPKDTLDEFLLKTESAIQNIADWINKTDEQEMNHLRLANIYFKLKRYKLLKITRFFLKILEPFILKKLKFKNPKLYYFDVYRLSKLIDMV